MVSVKYLLCRKMLALYFIFLTSFISGCSNSVFHAKKDDTEIIVRWLVVEDVDKTCRSLTVGEKLIRYNGCSIRNIKTNACTVITGREFTNELLGHEVHHCFYGHFH